MFGYHAYKTASYMELFKSLIESGGVLFGLILLLILNNYIFSRIKPASGKGSIVKRSIAAFLVFAGVLTFILSLPIDHALKGQILSFLGIIISAGIALSSTTVLGNLIAGFMNNSMNRFRNGDLIRIGEFQGRVIRKSAFHTEIQLEDSNFVTIPNLYMASNPVKLTRKSNTVVSTSVSLGYDISRHRIEEALKSAAIETGLKDPYVYITSLDDYSVVYKIHGFLADSSKFFTTTSMLLGNVMDTLHEHDIEIVSPSFMNQRQVHDKTFIPVKKAEEAEPIIGTSPEDLIFDEAFKSEEVENKKEMLVKIEKKQAYYKAKLKETSDEKALSDIKSVQLRLEELKRKIEKQIEEEK